MKPRLNQEGQAVVEYVLLLVLVIAIMVAVTSTLFTPVKKWTDFYLGTYTTCLLDYGVLPGSSGSSISQCQQQAINSGMAGNSSAGNNPNANSAAQNAENASAQKAAARAEQMRANAAAHRNNKRGGNSYAGPQGPVNMSTGRGTNEAAIGETGSGGSIVRTERLGKSQQTRPKQAFERKIQTRGVSGILDDLDRTVHAGEPTISKVDADLPASSSKRMPFRPPPPKAPPSDAEDSGKFNIGNFFRLIMMAMIILAVVYVVGSQLNSISKSMDG